MTPGTSMLSIVPVSDLWIEANYRETQVGRMQVGDPVSIELDTNPGKTLCGHGGHVESIAPASGSEFALIPADNATGILPRSYGGSRCVRTMPVTGFNVWRAAGAPMPGRAGSDHQEAGKQQQAPRRRVGPASAMSVLARSR